MESLAESLCPQLEKAYLDCVMYGTGYLYAAKNVPPHKIYFSQISDPSILMHSNEWYGKSIVEDVMKYTAKERTILDWWSNT